MKNLASLLIIPVLAFGNQNNDVNYKNQESLNVITNSSQYIESMEITNGGYVRAKLNDEKGIVDLVGRNLNDLNKVYNFNSFAGKGVPISAKISSNLPSYSYQSNTSGNNTIAQVTNSITQESVPSYVTGVEDVLMLVIGGKEYLLDVSSSQRGVVGNTFFIPEEIKIQNSFFGFK